MPFELMPFLPRDHAVQELLRRWMRATKKTTMMTTLGSMPMMMIIPKERTRKVRFRLCPVINPTISHFYIHYNTDDEVFYEEDMEIGVGDDDEDDEEGDIDDEFDEGTWNTTPIAKC